MRQQESFILSQYVTSMPSRHRSGACARTSGTPDTRLHACRLVRDLLHTRAVHTSRHGPLCSKWRGVWSALALSSIDGIPSDFRNVLAVWIRDPQAHLKCQHEFHRAPAPSSRTYLSDRILLRSPPSDLHELHLSTSIHICKICKWHLILYRRIQHHDPCSLLPLLLLPLLLLPPMLLILPWRSTVKQAV